MICLYISIKVGFFLMIGLWYLCNFYSFIHYTIFQPFTNKFLLMLKLFNQLKVLINKSSIGTLCYQPNNISNFNTKNPSISPEINPSLLRI